MQKGQEIQEPVGLVPARSVALLGVPGLGTTLAIPPEPQKKRLLDLLPCLLLLISGIS